MEYKYKDLTHKIIGAAIEVHRVLGRGFLESVYSKALSHELALREIPFERELPLVVYYKNQPVGEFKPDLLVDRKIVIELKCGSGIHEAHLAQTLNYLTATGLQLGLILNFGLERVQCRRVVL